MPGDPFVASWSLGGSQPHVPTVNSEQKQGRVRAGGFGSPASAVHSASRGPKEAQRMFWKSITLPTADSLGLEGVDLSAF